MNARKSLIITTCMGQRVSTRSNRAVDGDTSEILSQAFRATSGALNHAGERPSGATRESGLGPDPRYLWIGEGEQEAEG